MEEFIALLKQVHTRMDGMELIMSMNVRWHSEDDAKKVLESLLAIQHSLAAIEAALPQQEEVHHER